MYVLLGRSTLSYLLHLMEDIDERELVASRDMYALSHHHLLDDSFRTDACIEYIVHYHRMGREYHKDTSTAIGMISPGKLLKSASRTMLN